MTGPSPEPPIRVWDYRREYAEHREQILATIDRVLSSGTLILGPEVRGFETDFARYCGTRQAVGVDNATNGLFLALRALGIGSGDEVITVPNTAVPTATAIAQAGAVPRFVDIDAGTALMNVELLPAAISARTRAVIPVHLYGQCVDMTALSAVADAYGLHVIEDCAQAHGARQHGRVSGSMGAAGVFSFYPTKPLGGYGDGGAITTDDEDLADRLRRLRFYGMTETYYSEGEGYNSRLDEVHAALLARALNRLDASIERRRVLARRYDELLADLPLRPIATSPGNDHVYYLYPVRSDRRDELLPWLRARGVELNISYPWPIHVMPGFASSGYRPGDFPVSEQHAEEVFSLPMFPSLREEEVDRVVSAVKAFFRSPGAA